ncbi:DMT family transporter [Gaetbulibacter aestuarii]|uniref:DMT family transporter n=1 Tax=Gaetbulibacter aestuarii TaxID=1502358 RepID=A0ABW7MXZ1_9FLAO
MQNAKLKNYLHLHLLVFIAGFTAILGQLISINAIPLVWYRMVFACVFMFVYIKIRGIKLQLKSSSVVKLALAGIIIALHWITFFGSIKTSNVSIALAMFSTGAFFASLIEPLIFKRRIIWYEILFGLIVIFGVYIITKSEINHLTGIILGVLSAFLSAFFAVLNGRFIKSYSSTVISFYEFVSGMIAISIYLLIFSSEFIQASFFNLSTSDFWYLIILASICTAYAFIAAVHVMRVISPYTVVLTYNLEPVYGIILAVFLFPEKESMSPSFYYGAILIISTVLINALLKNIRIKKRKPRLRS